MTILLTGGTGYIGSHTAVILIEAGYDVVLFDNLSNSTLDVVKKIESLVGKEVPFQLGDLRIQDEIETAFVNHEIDCVIHFAGLKSVGESVKMPDLYFANNVDGTANLVKVMARHGVKKMVFSSSATVYGDPAKTPIQEDFPLSATNPYGQTKLIIEQMLQAVAQEDPEWQITLLRYFNPVGAHKSGLLGENPKGIPNNLMPYIQLVAAGQQDYLSVFGNDYPTHDGTGVRDYIHVCDLAEGHLAALKHLRDGVQIFNLGTGNGFSVLEVVHAFEEANGIRIPTKFAQRREGDVAICFAATEKAKEELGWQATRTLYDMCKDAWNFYSKLVY